MLKMLEAEFKKIKRQKFILLTVLAACLFPIPLTIVIVHSKLNYDTLLMFVMEFGFFGSSHCFGYYCVNPVPNGK